MKDPKKLFVYGTLRRDMHKAPYRRALDEDGTVQGYGKVAGRMYDLGAFPGVVPPESDEEQVTGQVIDFTTFDDTRWKRRLATFDRYEGAPNLYRRELVDVALDDGTVEPAWIYIYNRPIHNPDRAFVPSGDWKEIRT